MTSGTPPNTSLVLTDNEIEFINRRFAGSKSAAIHAALGEIMATSYQYIEDNGGGLFLFVFDADDGIVAGIQDLEYAAPGEWGDVATDLESDPIAAVQTWEGQMEDAAEQWNYIQSHEFGYAVVCENGRIYPNRMGAAAKRYFGIN